MCQACSAVIPRYPIWLAVKDLFDAALGADLCSRVRLISANIEKSWTIESLAVLLLSHIPRSVIYARLALVRRCWLTPPDLKIMCETITFQLKGSE